MAYFAASCGSIKTEKKFAESLSLDYPILCDPDRKVAKAYGVVSGSGKYPSRWTFYIGKDGRILYIDRKVHFKTHGADVVARLKELGIPRKVQP